MKEENPSTLHLPTESTEIIQESSTEEETVQPTVKLEKAGPLNTQSEKKDLVAPSVEDILSYAAKSMDTMAKKWENVKSEQFVFVRELTHNEQKIKTKHTFPKRRCHAFGDQY